MFQFFLSEGTGWRGKRPVSLLFQALGCVPLYSNPRPQFQWGTVANGTSTGLSGMLARGEVDVTVGAVFGDWRKQLVASFGTPLYAGGGGDLTFAAPRAVPKRWGTGARRELREDNVVSQSQGFSAFFFKDLLITFHNPLCSFIVRL